MSNDKYNSPVTNYSSPETEGMDLEEKQGYVNANIWATVEKIGKKISFARDIRALWRYMNDGSISWYRKSIVVAALIYFISPIDAIPDMIPLVGYLDDLGVIAATLKFLGSEIKAYYD